MGLNRIFSIEYHEIFSPKFGLAETIRLISLVDCWHFQVVLAFILCLSPWYFNVPFSRTRNLVHSHMVPLYFVLRYKQVLKWAETNLSERTFQLILSFLVARFCSHYVHAMSTEFHVYLRAGASTTICAYN